MTIADGPRETPELTHAARQPVPPQPSRLQLKRGPVAALAVLVVAGLIALAFLLLRRGDGSTTVPPVGAPVAATKAQLDALAKKTPHPVYWAGAKAGAYELTRTVDGRIYVRYLPSADKVGNREPNYLTVGTYPTKKAFLALRRAAARPGGVSLKLPNGGLLVFNTQTPKSVYFTYPGARYQVEVYDPSPAEARTLVLAGRITPIR
jgi:hypothetical protein